MCPLVAASLYATRFAARDIGRSIAPEGGVKARSAGRLDRDCSAERVLIEAAQRDRGRFADLYEANFERVYAYVIRRVRDRDEAQDITSDVFHLALKSLPRFEWRGVPFAAWLYRIAANEIADRSKSIAKRRAHESLFQESDAGVDGCVEHQTMRSGGGGWLSSSSGCCRRSIAGGRDAVCGG